MRLLGPSAVAAPQTRRVPHEQKCSSRQVAPLRQTRVYNLNMCVHITNLAAVLTHLYSVLLAHVLLAHVVLAQSTFLPKAPPACGGYVFGYASPLPGHPVREKRSRCCQRSRAVTMPSPRSCTVQMWRWWTGKRGVGRHAATSTHLPPALSVVTAQPSPCSSGTPVAFQCSL